ncbi:MAG: hypothetical protein ACLUNV_06610 [Sutterella wadsworthensis]
MSQPGDGPRHQLVSAMSRPRIPAGGIGIAAHQKAHARIVESVGEKAAPDGAPCALLASAVVVVAVGKRREDLGEAPPPEGRPAALAVDEERLAHVLVLDAGCTSAAVASCQRVMSPARTGSEQGFGPHDAVMFDEHQAHASRESRGDEASSLEAPAGLEDAGVGGRGPGIGKRAGRPRTKGNSMTKGTEESGMGGRRLEDVKSDGNAGILDQRHLIGTFPKPVRKKRAAA